LYPTVADETVDGPDQPRFCVTKVTPELATKWLEQNSCNRSARDRIISAYARDMESDRWRLTGEAIKFSHSGRLLDGQHRLHAVQLSGRTVEMFVVYDLPDDVQEVIDSGTARTTGDALKMRNESNSLILAAAARAAIIYKADRFHFQSQLKHTHSEIIAFLEKNPDLRTAADLSALYRNQIDIPPSVLALSIWRLAQTDSDASSQFFYQLAEKTNLNRGDPILALIKVLIKIRRESIDVSRGEYLSLVFRAWNNWRRHKVISTLPILRVNDGIPEPY
jgi:hypothetical protein